MDRELTIPKTAIRLPASADEESILDSIRTWVGCLARLDYETAHGLTGHEAYFYNLDGQKERFAWTPDHMREVIEGYGQPDPDAEIKYQVTPISEAHCDSKPEQCVDWCDAPLADSRIGLVYFDLPLNGEWSDLTAIFDLRKVDGALVLVLDDIHVM